MASTEINENCHYVQNATIGVRLNLKNFILISCAVMKLLRKVSQGGGIALSPPPPPPGEIGLKNAIYGILSYLTYDAECNNFMFEYDDILSRILNLKLKISPYYNHIN